MKKYISFLLTVIICIGLFSFSAFAANEKIVVKAVPSTSTLAIGETFTVDFNLTTNAGFYTLGLEVDYDKDILEVVCPKHVEGKNCLDSRSPVTNKYNMSGVSNNASDSRYHTSTPYKIMWGFSLAEEDCVYLGRMATLTFKVKALPSSGKTTISLVVDQSSSVENGKYSDAQRSGVSSTVSITCSKHSFGAWSQIKAATCTEKGSESRTCSVCNKTETRDIAMKAHNFGTDKVCDVCGYKNFVLGDIDRTGKVDMDDVSVLAKHLVDYEVNCNKAALDVSGDGLINLKDLVLLAQYVAGWDVKLY